MMSAAHRHGRTAERDEVREALKQAVVESARTVHFAEARSEASSDGLRLLMHSNVQTDAIALIALLEIDAADPMLPKLMAGIMDDRDPKRGGRWLSTHANAWALVAASRYFATIEKDEPDYAAKVWIDDMFAGEHAFRGRSMTKVDQSVSMETIQGAPSRTLTLSKDGPGKLYYRMGLRYAPKDLKLAAVDNGFTIYREYEALPKVDGTVDPDAVKQTEDGNWIVKAGTDVKVTINLIVSDRANYVVVDDPLPGGFEGLNPKFVTNANAMSSQIRGRRSPAVESDGWWWGWRHRFDHTDLRDDRMLLFADQMAAGVYSYSYSARATTIGDFLLAPVKAEEMYEPDSFRTRLVGTRDRRAVICSAGLMEPTDLDLLASWRDGDAKAGNALFDRYFDALFRFFRNKVQDGAEDLVQQTFLALVQSRDRFRGDASFRTYLFTAARSKLYNYLERRGRDGVIDYGVTSCEDLGISPSAMVGRDEQHKHLLLALRQLPVDMQVALELYYSSRSPPGSDSTPRARSWSPRTPSWRASRPGRAWPRWRRSPTDSSGGSVSCEPGDRRTSVGRRDG